MAYVEFWFPQIPQVNMRLIAIKEKKYFDPNLLPDWNWKVGITRFEYVPKSLPCSGYSIFSLMCMLCRLLFVLLYFFWPFCCLFFDLWILITPLVSSNSSLLIHYFGTYMYISYIFAINTLSRVCCYDVYSYVLYTDLIKQLNLLSKYLSWMPKEKRKKNQNQC